MIRRDKNGVRVGDGKVTLFDGPGIVNYQYRQRWMSGPGGAATVIGIGAGAGAATGAVVKGKKGAVVGALVGAGAATGVWLYKNRTDKTQNLLRRSAATNRRVRARELFSKLIRALHINLIGPAVLSSPGVCSLMALANLQGEHAMSKRLMRPFLLVLILFVIGIAALPARAESPERRAALKLAGKNTKRR